tara:strand:+ start:465 stop:878 length:414 start_codon:yes stop_codon:yes gene_type:complete
MIEENSEKEFKVLNLSIEKFSLLYGLFLVIWGVIISFISGSGSVTSYIPSFLGLPILVFSYLAIKFSSKKKVFMHIVVIFGVIIFLGGVDLIRSFVSGSAFNNLWADISKLMMLLTGFYFSLQCIKSFIFARRNKNQ